MLPIELLEQRRLLSITLLNHYMNVTGTAHSDQIKISAAPRGSGYLIQLNGNVQQFAERDVLGIYVDAGGGNDRVEVGNMSKRLFADIQVKGGAGNDLLVASRRRLQVWGMGGDDTLIGSGGGDYLYGDGDDYQGEETGNDLILGRGGDDYLEGGPGNDTVMGGRGDDVILGGRGDDLLSGNGGVDAIGGGEGSDRITAGSGADSADGDEGNDRIEGGAGDDEIGGGNGNDTLYGHNGDDYLIGDDDDVLDWAPNSSPRKPGDDLLHGGEGRDTLAGSHESDSYHYDNGRDTMVGGPGDDLVDARGNDVFADRSSGGRLGSDYVLVSQHHANSDAYVIRQTAHLSISHKFNDGQGFDVPIPAGIGQFGPHPSFFTSDKSGALRMQDTVNRPFKLREFFENWGFLDLNIEEDHFRMTVNGVESDAGLELVLHDGDRIQIIYGHR